MSNDRYAGPVAEPRAHALAVLPGGHRNQLVPGDQLKPHLPRHLQVGRLVQRPSHARQRGARGIQQALLERAPERRPVEVALAVVLIPRVRVRVQQHQRHRPVHGGLRAQLAEHDRVVAPEHERHDPGADNGLAALRRSARWS